MLGHCQWHAAVGVRLGLGPARSRRQRQLSVHTDTAAAAAGAVTASESAALPAGRGVTTNLSELPKQTVGLMMTNLECRGVRIWNAAREHIETKRLKVLTVTVCVVIPFSEIFSALRHIYRRTA